MTERSRTKYRRDPAGNRILGDVALRGLVVLSLTACGGGPRLPDPNAALIAAERERQYREATIRLVGHQVRLLDVGSRMLVANADLCDRHARFVGLITANLHELRETYGRRGIWGDFGRAIAKTYGIGDSVTVLSVVPNSPAAQAGIVPGDVILGQRIVESENDTSRGESVNLYELRRADKDITVRVPLVLQCAASFTVTINDLIDANTDGDEIRVTTSLIRFTSTEDDLAIIVGHEIAHVVLPHLIRRVAAPSLGNRRRFEREADHVGTYLAARAGFDVTNAVAFWRRWATESPQLISERWSKEHPGTPERVVRIQHTIAEIQEKRRAGLPIVPYGMEGRIGNGT